MHRDRAKPGTGRGPSGTVPPSTRGIDEAQLQAVEGDGKAHQPQTPIVRGGTPRGRVASAAHAPTIIAKTCQAGVQARDPAEGGMGNPEKPRKTRTATTLSPTPREEAGDESRETQHNGWACQLSHPTTLRSSPYSQILSQAPQEIHPPLSVRCSPAHRSLVSCCLGKGHKIAERPRGSRAAGSGFQRDGSVEQPCNIVQPRAIPSTRRDRLSNGPAAQQRRWSLPRRDGRLPGRVNQGEANPQTLSCACAVPTSRGQVQKVHTRPSLAIRCRARNSPWNCDGSRSPSLASGPRTPADSSACHPTS